MVTALAVPATAVVVAAVFATLAVGEAALLRQRALAAADLAALAAVTSGCPAAAGVAEANRTRLAECTLEPGGDAVVRIDAGPPAMLARIAAVVGAQIPSADASARAGLPASN